MGKAVGVGGIFLKSRDPKALKAWYVENLGIPDGYSGFEGPESYGTTVFSFFPESSTYFGEDTQRAMINFRVDSMEEIVARLTQGGARIDPKQESHEYGKFAWFWDPEGNRVELWEPVADTPDPA
jgi:predicted enzyme related to lactoylglutathione lyase